MSQEEKDLLLKDLCARLPYGIKFPYHIYKDSNHREYDCIATMDTISEDTVEFTYDENGTIRDWSCNIKEIKPYLRPMSSMTDEELNEYENFITNEKDDRLRFCNELVFYNSHHLDYRGLIPKGLALEASEDMYDSKK